MLCTVENEMRVVRRRATITTAMTTRPPLAKRSFTPPAAASPWCRAMVWVGDRLTARRLAAAKSKMREIGGARLGSKAPKITTIVKPRNPICRVNEAAGSSGGV